MDILDILIVEHLTNRVIFFIERFGYHHLDIIENSKDAIIYLVNNLYDYIFLGGELGKNDGYGFDIASFLAENSGNPNCNSELIIHTWNIVEADMMIKLLPQAKYLPFDESQYSAFTF